MANDTETDERGTIPAWFGEILKWAVRPPEAAYCTGCHGDKSYHLLICHDDRERVHLYVNKSDAEANALLDLCILEARRFSTPVEEFATSGPARRHAHFRLPG